MHIETKDNQLSCRDESWFIRKSQVLFKEMERLSLSFDMFTVSELSKNEKNIVLIQTNSELQKYRYPHFTQLNCTLFFT